MVRQEAVQLAQPLVFLYTADEKHRVLTPLG